MIYASCLDLEIRFGAEEIARLAARTGVVWAAAADAALGDAAAEIETALGTRYDLPLPDGRYPSLTAIASDLARARLYDDVAPEVVTERARGARAALRRIAVGTDPLVEAAGVQIPPRATSSPAVSAGPALVMTPATLRGL